jgi:hypothetical protein
MTVLTLNEQFNKNHHHHKTFFLWRLSYQMNEMGRCHDADASCVRPTAPVSCAELHHEDDFLVVLFIDNLA